MAIVQRMKSDLTGKEDEPEKFGSFIIRKGPGIERAIALDVLPEEIGPLTEAADVFVVEYRQPGGVSEEIIVTLKELTDKVVPKGKMLDDITDTARSLRGRRPGSQLR